MRIVRGCSLSGYGGFKSIVDAGDYKIVRPLIQFTKDELKQYDIDNNVKFYVDSSNEKDKYIKDVLKNNSSCDKIFLAIGPEGGISPKEEELLEKKGFLKITLGSQIMRVETVPIFLASIIKYEFTE